MGIDLSKLNPPQRAAVEHGSGPMLVLAGAGSGKTRVITFRMVRLLEQGIPPEAICAVTFTNKAAEEMRERVAHLLGDKKTAAKLTMGTFHALGLRILREERKALGMPRGFTIYDAADQLGAVREALRGTKDVTRDGERRFDVKAILTRISLAKNTFVSPEQYQPRPSDDYDLITAEVYPRYQEALRGAAAYDFDDLIVEPVRLFENPEVGARWRERFRYVMVDEYQDTNKAQLMMVTSLVSQHRNLTVVGDDDQSIYSWRGADPTNILRFGEMFPGAKIVKLEQNYRSSRTILEAANAVIANNKQRHGKTLWSDHAAGLPITHAVARDTEQEAQWVARELVKLHADGRKWTDFAVMYRSNLQSKLLEEQLREHAVPYVMYGGQQFFERKEVKDLIAYLRVAVNPKDELALRRIINYPARGIGATTVEKLVSTAHSRHATLWDVLREVGQDAEPIWTGATVTAVGSHTGSMARFDDVDADPLPSSPTSHLAVPDLRPATCTAISELVDIVTRCATSLRRGESVTAATRRLIEDIKLYDDLRDASGSGSAAQRRIDNVEGLMGSLEKHEAKAKGQAALADYLRLLSLQSDSEEEVSGERVILTTLHGSKGLEFPVCFMVGMEEELLPHARTLQPQATDVMDADHATDISEERRLCYVGITRAQQKLYLTRACTRVSRGKPMVRTPSRFLLEVPDDLLEVKDLADEAAQQVPHTDVKSFFSNFSFDE
ncbi:MAG: UvrD-helicase domain-containing protein [Deltaproteobacteria bacterium]|nr:UvrD-helicase domain-containing protein [Deltaproteobacteria bacterium]